jgi:glucosylceramidase
MHRPVFVCGIVAVGILGLTCSKDESGPTGPTCPIEQIACGEVCVAVLTDSSSCGGCGLPCPTGQTCQAGACRCASGVLCNGACVPPDVNPCTEASTPGSILVVSAPSAYWMTDGQATETTTGSADVTADDTVVGQTWEGMGGAFNELGWHYLSMLSETNRSLAMQLLYGADGARFALGRIPIGASDYAMDRYTLDETPDDVTLAGFSIARDRERLLPFVKAAQAVKPNIRFWASPWTPPTWMKQGPFNATPFDGGTMKGDDITLAAYAQYLIRFVQAYAAEGIAIETVSPQNEPGYSGTYPTCGWAPETYARLVGGHLGPAIAAAGLTTKIMLGSFNGGPGDTDIVGTVLGDATARGFVDVLGYQWGMQGKVGGVKSYLPVWQSEHKCGNYPWETKTFNPNLAPNDNAYAVESWGLIRDWIRAGVTSYSAWNMVLDTVGVGNDSQRVWPQNALLTVDTAQKTLNVTPTYFVFRHVSQFVVPGAKVVATKGGDAVAFRNPDGSVVVVMYNAGAAKPTMTVAAAGKLLQFALPAAAWATVVVR